MMNGKEKLYFLLGAIEDARTITPSGQPLLIHSTHNLNRKYRDIELEQIFVKLEKDEKILKVLTAPNRPASALDEFGPYDRIDDGYWHIELLPAFNSYFLKIQHEPEYQKFTGKKPQSIPVMPLNRQSLEKIWRILQEIEIKRGITLAGDNIFIPSVRQSTVKSVKEAQEAADERFNILKKLESEERAIEDVRWSQDLNQYIYLKIGDRYSETFAHYEQEYKSITNDPQSNKPSLDGIIYEIKYSEKTRKILINNFLLKQPRSFGGNEAIFSYLFDNPNQEKTIEDIISGTGLESDIDLNKFVENLGFKGDLRKVFFRVSKDTVQFNNPITKTDLDDLGIKQLKLGS